MIDRRRIDSRAARLAQVAWSSTEARLRREEQGYGRRAKADLHGRYSKSRYDASSIPFRAGAARVSGAVSAFNSCSRLSFSRVGAARNDSSQYPGWHINSVLPSGRSASSCTSSAVRNRPVIWNRAK